MKEKQTYIIAEKVFRTKTELKTFVKIILHKYTLGTLLDSTDFYFVSELLKRHPEYERKIGIGIKAIVVRPDGYWRTTKCFYILRVDGTETDFSYNHCIDNDISGEPLKMFKQSARTAIKDQVILYRTNYLKQNIDDKGYFICEKSKDKINEKDATVDHIPPLTFDRIITDFMQMRKIEPAKIEYEGFDDNEFNKRFKDESLSVDFADYHRQIAKLRVISKHENLTQPKKNFE